MLLAVLKLKHFAASDRVMNVQSAAMRGRVTEPR